MISRKQEKILIQVNNDLITCCIADMTFHLNRFILSISIQQRAYSQQWLQMALGLLVPSAFTLQSRHNSWRQALYLMQFCMGNFIIVSPKALLCRTGNDELTYLNAKYQLCTDSVFFFHASWLTEIVIGIETFLQ